MDGWSCVWLSESDGNVGSEGKAIGPTSGQWQARKHDVDRRRCRETKGVDEYMLNGDR